MIDSDPLRRGQQKRGFGVPIRGSVLAKAAVAVTGLSCVRRACVTPRHHHDRMQLALEAPRQASLASTPVAREMRAEVRLEAVWARPGWRRQTCRCTRVAPCRCRHCHARVLRCKRRSAVPGASWAHLGQGDQPMKSLVLSPVSPLSALCALASCMGALLLPAPAQAIVGGLPTTDFKATGIGLQVTDKRGADGAARGFRRGQHLQQRLRQPHGAGALRRARLGHLPGP